MIKTTHYCDNCGVPQGEGNHWFKVGEQPDYIGQSRLIFGAAETFEPEFGLDACGEECALKLASRFLRQGAELTA